MSLTGAIPEGPSFFCPHCGALYAVTYARLSSSDNNEVRCVVCGQIMDKWDSTKVPIFKIAARSSKRSRRASPSTDGGKSPCRVATFCCLGPLLAD